MAPRREWAVGCAIRDQCRPPCSVDSSRGMTTSNKAQSYESGQISPVFNHLWHHDARPTNPLSSLLATANLGDHRERLSQGTWRLRSLGSVAPLEFSGEKQRGHSSRCRILALEFAIHLHTLTCLIKGGLASAHGPPPELPLPIPQQRQTQVSGSTATRPLSTEQTPSRHLSKLMPGFAVSPNFHPQHGCANKIDEGLQSSSCRLSTLQIPIHP